MRIDPILMLMVAVLLAILGFLAGCDWTMTSYLDDLEGVTEEDGDDLEGVTEEDGDD